MGDSEKNLKLLEVIPISRGISSKVLTYFTTLDIPKGSLIKIPLRNKSPFAIVLKSSSASRHRSAIRGKNFALKKVTKLVSKSVLNEAFMAATRRSAKYQVASEGAILSQVLSKIILNNCQKLKTETITKIKKNSHEQLILQANDEERFSNYKSLIREEFARKSSVFFCLPTIQDIKKTLYYLPKGIERYTYIFHSSLTNKEFVANWNKIAAEKHPVLILSTGSFLSIPRSDVGTIVLERASSPQYKNQARPYTDIKKFAEFYSHEIGAKLIFGDLMLPTEMIWQHKSNDLADVAPPVFRSISTAKSKVVDMRNRDDQKSKFRVIGLELENLIKESKKESQSLYIFASRRGMAPITVCDDCETIVKCDNCNAPVVLHASKNNPFFLCHKCGLLKRSSDQCAKCKGWKLTALGIGIDRIEDEIMKTSPKTKIFRIDADSSRSHEKNVEIAENFYSSPGSILLGTEMSIPYLLSSVDNSAIASMDSLFAIPDFRVSERIINILLSIRQKTLDKIVVQTRKPDEVLFEYALKGNLMDYYRSEIKDRKKFNYPPFSLLIKITAEGRLEKILDEMGQLKKWFKPFDMEIFEAYSPVKGSRKKVHGVIRISRDMWVDESLTKKLIQLPLNYSINVDPQSLI